MNIDLFCSKELALRLRLKPARQIPHPELSVPVYEREPNSIMISTGKGMFVWGLFPALKAEMKTNGST